MNSQVCVTCRNEKPVNRTDNRLVTENCGHVKCMDCLLLEKAGCEACLTEKSEQATAEASDTDDGFAGDTAPVLAEVKRYEDTKNGFEETNKEFEETTNGFEVATNGFEEATIDEQVILEDLSKRKKLETSHIRIETGK